MTNGRERLEAAVAALPAEERAELVRRLGLGAGRKHQTVGRVWPGRQLPSTVVGYLRLQWDGSIHRTLCLRPPGSVVSRPASAWAGER